MKKVIVAAIAIGAALTVTRTANAQSMPGIVITDGGTTTIYKSGSCWPGVGTYCAHHLSADANRTVVLYNRTAREMRVMSWIVDVASTYASILLDKVSVRSGETKTIEANDRTAGRAVVTVWCQSGLGEPGIRFQSDGRFVAYCDG